MLLRACRDIDDPMVAVAVLGSLESARSVDSLAAADLIGVVERLPAALALRGRKLLAKVDGKLAARRSALQGQL
ncbi:MAG TPA: hypothetical protein DER64_12075, partial [Planctomycetaceae bacterium]|nr:hypothetical protein [Planctomycetaceae bacterium]